MIRSSSSSRGIGPPRRPSPSPALLDCRVGRLPPSLFLVNVPNPELHAVPTLGTRDRQQRACARRNQPGRPRIFAVSDTGATSRAAKNVASLRKSLMPPKNKAGRAGLTGSGWLISYTKPHSRPFGAPSMAYPKVQSFRPTFISSPAMMSLHTPLMTPPTPLISTHDKDD